MHILKAISSYSLHFAFFIISVSLFRAYPSETSLSNILKSIGFKNKETILFINQRYVSFESEKIRLQKSTSFSINGSPYFQKDEIKLPISGNIAINNYLFSASADPFSSDYLQNTVGFYFPVFSSKKKISNFIDTIINLEKLKSQLEIENIIVEELKQILLKLSEFCRIEDELQVRSEINLQIDTTNKYLVQFHQSGLLSNRDLTGLRFLYEDNLFQMNILRKNALSIFKYLNRNYSLDSSVFISKKYTLQIVDSMLSSGHFQPPFLISKIDSLNRAILFMQIKNKNNPNYNFYIGPTLKFDNQFNDKFVGVGAQFQVDIPGQLNVSMLIKSDKGIDPFFSAKPSNPLADTISPNDNFNTAKANKFIKTILEEVSMGNLNSIYFLPEIFNKITAQRINSVNSDYLRISYTLQSLRSIKELGLNLSQIEQ